MKTETVDHQPIEILFSYTHADEKLREQLESHLAALKRKKRIICWHDRYIRAGLTWRAQINEHLDTADIIIFLISPDFLNSDYCNNVEVRHALKRSEKGDVCIVPVILRRSDWKGEVLGEFQALPCDAKPVVEWSDLDVALYDVVKGLKEIIVEMEQARTCSTLSLASTPHPVAS
ncbi:MAG TPA: toll/interleukin-1 receptor domain-containing protein [Ktedonobacteraceae bacterium]